MNNNVRIQCNCTEGLKNFENCELSLQWLKQNYKSSQLSNLKKDYEKLVELNLPDQKQWQHRVQKQIERDIQRTFPSELFFQSEQGQKALQRLLYCIALYDVKVGYVQGMNFLIGALLYHGEEYVAFWNYVIIYEKLELRDIYLENLPGLSKHIQIIQLLCMSKQKALYDHLMKNQVPFQNFCIPWFLSLLAMVIPIQSYGLIFTQLIDQGWMFFYKLILSYLQHDYLLTLEGPELMMQLSSSNRLSEMDKCRWKSIMETTQDYYIDKNFINQMLSSFDQEKQIFLVRKQ